MLTHKQLRAKALDIADVRAEFQKLSGEYALLDEFLKARAAQELTPNHLAGASQQLPFIPAP